MTPSATEIGTSPERADHVRKAITGLALALVAAALLAACASSASEPAPVAEGRWTMVQASFGMPGGGIIPTLEFRGGRVFAYSGCNRASGPFQDDGGRLAVGALMSTRMGCRDALNDFEIRYYALLAANPEFRLDGETLTLTAGDDTARFARVRGPVTRVIELAPTRVECVGVTRMSCLQWREKPDEPWRRHYGEIAGFAHRPGTTYVLRIREEPVAKAPADASSVRWVLEQVLQERIE